MDGLVLRDIEFIEARDVLGRIVFGLSADDYADAAVNNAATLRTLEQRKAQVKYYRNCIAALEPKKEAPKRSLWSRMKFWSNDGESETQRQNP